MSRQAIDPAPFSFQPPPGGDITLKSSDGAVFVVHSLMLKLASSVFADMFASASEDGAILLRDDDSESVSLMLRFIYPYPPFVMDDSPGQLLFKSLRMAEKYDISGIIKAVDYQLSHSSKRNSLVHSDPIYALFLASRYNLPQTRQTATAVAQTGHFELRDPKHIERLAKSLPDSGTASVISLLGARCIQNRLLCDLLFKGMGGIQPYNNEPIMMCEGCYPDDGFYDDNGDPFPYHPSWLDAWSIRAFCDLTTLPFHQASRAFQLSSLDALYGEVSVCRSCVDCARDTEGGAVFLDWAQRVSAKVKKILDDVEPLYNL